MFSFLSVFRLLHWIVKRRRKEHRKKVCYFENFYFSWSLALGVLFRCCLLTGLFFKFDVSRENVLKNMTAVFSDFFFPIFQLYLLHLLFFRTSENSRLNRVYVFICVPHPLHPSYLSSSSPYIVGKIVADGPNGFWICVKSTLVQLVPLWSEKKKKKEENRMKVGGKKEERKIKRRNRKNCWKNRT